MKNILLALVVSTCLPSSAGTVRYVFSGVTTINRVEEGPITTEFPVGTRWTAQVDWDTAAAPETLIETQSRYRLSKFTFSLHGTSGVWTTSSLAGKPAFTMNYIFGGTRDEIQFTSGWGPESLTNQTIENWQPYSINLTLSDFTGTAIPALSPVPKSLNPGDWNLPSGNSTFKMYLNNNGDRVIYGTIQSFSSLFQPEISVQAGNAELTDGTGKVALGTVKTGNSGIARTITIKNTGKAKLSGLSLKKSGLNPNDFVVTALPTTSLTSGASTSFKVTFKPTAAGARNARLQIMSNDTDESPFDIKLTGTATE